MQDVLQVRGVYYTVPWALYKDEGGQFWLRLDYHTSALRGGTAQLEVTINSREDIVCRMLPGHAWTWSASDVSHWQRHGLVIAVQLVD